MRNAPDYIQFYPTLRCNRSCDFCFNKRLPASPDMNFKNFRLMLDRLSANTVRIIDIIGGEPTIHPDILMFIQEAHARGLHTNISSNGTDSRILEEIAGTRGGATVGISVNDWQTFEQVQQFIRNYAPIVKMVYTEPIDQRLIDAVLSLNPQQFYLIYRDAIQEDDLQYSLPFYRFKAGVAALPQAARIGTVSCSGFLPDFDTYPELSLVRCPAGTTKLGVMPDGSVYPCNLLFGRNEFMLGNILTDPFDAIWRHPVLAFFRTYQGNTCPKFGCELHSRCHGGCPAHSFLLSGDLAGPDPRCFMP